VLNVSRLPGCCLVLLKPLFGLRQLDEVAGGVLGYHDLATIKQRNPIVDPPFPATANFATNRSHRWFSHASVRSSGLVRPDVCRPDIVVGRAASTGPQ
jgi:hypothetical protein